MKRRSLRKRTMKGKGIRLSTRMNTPLRVKGATPKGIRKY